MHPVSNRNQWLDLCRAMAILLVVAAHGLFFVPWSKAPMMQRLFGYFGVEIFFCLSGFLIGSIFMETVNRFEESPSAILLFMIRRWLRTIPNYYFFLALNLCLFALAWTFEKPEEVGKYLVFCQNLLTPHPNFFPEAWSLAIEEIFYFLLPISFAGFWTLLRKPLPALLASLVAILAGSMTLRWYGAHSATLWDEGVRKVALYRVDSLMWGVLLSVAYRKFLVTRPRATLLLAACLLLVLSVSVYSVSRSTEWLNSSFFAKFWIFTITSVGICGLLLAGLRIKVPVKIDAIFEKIARLSYSMYLSNLASLFTVLHFFGMSQNAEGAAVRVALYLGIIFALSNLSYRCIELPFLRLRRKYFPDEKTARYGSAAPVQS
ncbi:MAG TPA: acyltransferase [Paraburkholderia sp.]|nr:acyltransferase [Paraburkholderia sp.]